LILPIKGTFIALFPSIGWVVLRLASSNTEIVGTSLPARIYELSILGLAFSFILSPDSCAQNIIGQRKANVTINNRIIGFKFRLG
jgi:hypothetical protein